MRAASIAVALLAAGCSATYTPVADMGSSISAFDQQKVGTTRYISKINTGICQSPDTLSQLDCMPWVPVGAAIKVVGATTSRGLTVFEVDHNGRRGFMGATVVGLDTISEEEKGQKVAAKKECDRRGGVSVGMTAAQVTASCWGKPNKVNSTITGGGRREQWVYGSQYVYVENGVVTAIQTSR